MIDACGNESFNEFLIIDSGNSGFNTDDFFLNFDINRNVNGPENNDVNTNVDNWPADQTPCGVTFGNPGVITGCSNVISIGANFDVPPNVWVVFQISNGADEPYDFSSICGTGECIYVLANSCTRSGGGLSNATGAAPRSTEVGLTSGCSNIYTHDRTLLTQAEGAYWIPATDTYGVNTCGAPPIGTAPPAVTFNNPGNVSVCNSYTLPPITGSGLSGNEAYFTGPGGTGLLYMAGQTITGNTTIYITDITQSCVQEESFTITITPPATPVFSITTTYCAGEVADVLPNTSNNAITGGWSPAIIDNMNSGTYTFTPGPGECANPVTLNVTITSAITPTFSITDTYCQGATIPALPGASDNGVNGTWSPAVVDNMNSGSYTFTPNAGQCAGPFTLNVTITSGITPTFTIQNTYCQGDVVAPLPTVSDNAVNGNWNPGTIDNVNSGSYTFTPNPGECASTFVLNVTITPGATPVFSLTDVYCAGDVADALPNISDNGISGNWNPGTIDNMNSGSYTFTPNAGQCAGPFTLNVTITPGTTPTFNIQNTYCQGDVVAPLPTVSDNGINGSWNPGGIDNMNSGSYTFTPNPGQCASPFTLNVTITPGTMSTFTIQNTYCQGDVVAPLPTVSDNGINGSWNPGGIDNVNSGSYTFTPNPGQCASPFTLNVTITPGITPTFTIQNMYCQGDVVTPLPTVSDNGINGSWNPGGIDNVNSGSYTFTPNPGQCASPFTLNVTIIPGTMPTFTIQNMYCQGDVVAPLPTVSDNGINGSWNPGGIDNVNSGSYTFTPNPGQCASQYILNVTIFPAATPVFNIPAIFCQGATISNLPGTSDNGVNGSWSPSVVDNMNSGVYTFTPDPGLCAQVFTHNITIAPQPVATTTTLFACEESNGVATFDLTQSNNVINGGTGNDVTWYLDNTAMNEINNPEDFTTSSVTLFVQVNNGTCTSEIVPVEITVNLSPILDLNIAATIDCNGSESGALNLEIIGQMPFQYNWSDNTLDGEEDPVGLAAGTYSVTVSDGNNCEASTSITIDEPGQLDLNCSADMPPTGPGLSDGKASFEISDGTAPYSYTLSGPVNSAEQNLIEGNYTLDNLLAGNYTVLFTDANGCSISCSFTIQDADCDLMLSLTPNNSSCNDTNDGSISSVVTGGTPDYQYDWSNDIYDGQSNISDLNPGLYSLTVTDDSGCMDSESITISEPSSLVLDCHENGISEGNGSGSYSFSFSGSTPPYQLELNGPFSHSLVENIAGTWDSPVLSPGDYTFTLFDANQCEETCTFTISCGLSLGITGNDPACAGGLDGSIDLMITGNQPITSIDWNEDSLDGQEDPQNISAGTYTVIVVDEIGCTQTISITLNDGIAFEFDCMVDSQPGGPSATDGSINVVVNNGPTGPYTISYDNSEGVNGTIPGNLGNNIINNLPSGIYEISISNGNCTAECIVMLSATSCTFTLVETTTSPSCNGSLDGSLIVTPEGGDGNYTFDWSDDQFDGLSNLSELGASIYQLTVTDGLGCISMTSIELTEPSVLEIDCSDTTDPNSQGSSDGSLILEVMGGTPPYTVTWSGPVNGTDNSITEGTLAINNLSEGAYVVMVEDDNGCTVSCNFNLNAPGCDLSLEINGTNPDCAGDANGSIDLIINGSQNIVSIDWNDDSLDGTEDPQNLAAGTYSVTVTDEVGCIQTIPVVLQEPANIVLTCNISQQPTGEGVSDGIINVVISDGPTGSYTIAYDNAMGVSGSITGTLGDNPISGLPEGNFTIEVTLGECMESCQLNLEAEGCIIPAESSYFETLCPGETVTVGGVNFDESNTNDQVILPGAANNGCDSIINVQISFYDTAVFTFEADLCTGESLQLGGMQFDEDNPSGIVVLAGASSNGCDSTITVNVFFLPPAESMLDTVLCFNASLEVGNTVFNRSNPSGTVALENAAANGCDSIILVNTSYEPENMATLVGDTVLCEGEVTSLRLFTNGGFTYDYIIQPSVGLEILGTEVTGSQTVDVTPTTSSSFVLSNIVAANGCPVIVDSPEVEITVSHLNVLAEVSSDYNGFGVSCAEAEDGTAIVMASQGLTPYTYNWSNGNQSAEIAGLGIGNYFVTVTDGIGCVQEANVSLNGPLPILVEATGHGAGCLENSDGQILINNISGGGDSFEYSLDGTFFTSITNFPQSIPEISPGNYTLFVQDANDCSQSVDIIVDSGAELSLDLGPDAEIRLGDSILLQAQMNFLPDSWQWKPETYLSQPDTFITYATPMESMVYELEVINENGCKVSDQIRIIVSKKVDVFVPNSFSPNGDGVNDKLQIFAGKGVEHIEQFQIFDRWGNQLYVEGPFFPNGASHGWDGRRNGEDMNSGVYVFFVEVVLIGGEAMIVKGDVSLMR
ncbi:MAG: hypothetical protein DHS20C18_29600 [Saprospiraceae bacterium]|nr:MAG: hypothetical protein DHS20C18_29600 [Saprospiraceae bacterium]